jgi:DMSO/TMAO reductase YedYZ molybdopterin-dependent catalytic subunit
MSKLEHSLANHPIDEADRGADQSSQPSVDAGLVVRSTRPLNGEIPVSALTGSMIVPNAHFYIRCHFDVPKLEAESYRLTVSGLVERPLSLGLDAISNIPSETRTVTLECAGNGRTLFHPPIAGEQWTLGAVSTAEWTGVPLVKILNQAGVRHSAQEVLFRGADGGAVDGHSDSINFERSLGLDDPILQDTLLVYAMNGETLPIEHGYPLRLVVPGWYAVASVKWLTEITLIGEPFVGHYQKQKYWYEWEREGRVIRKPVRRQQVRALIVGPIAGQEVPRGELTIRGVAWSGTAPVAEVEVSVDDGGWEKARLMGERKPYCWRWWELVKRCDSPGVLNLRARATDLSGNTQPNSAEWNRLGYGNNSIQQVLITVV